MDIGALTEFFAKCGLADNTAKTIVKDKGTAQSIHDFFRAHGLDTPPVLPQKQAQLALQIAKDPTLSQDDAGFILQKVHSGDLKSAAQVSAGIDYLKASNPREGFDKACGVNFTISSEDLRAAVERQLAAHPEIDGWKHNKVFADQVKASDELKWAPPKDVKDTVDAVFVDKFGPRAAAAAAEPKKKKQQPPKDTSKPSTTTNTNIFEEGWLSKLHPVGGNPQIHPELREAHLKATGGKVTTRFPPEPNGFLHVGHSKAIAINFGFAQYHGGKCILRFDDTNPEAEKQIYVEKTIEIVRWLGYEPWKITYSSDNFDQLYTWALDLIDRGLAYVTNDTPEEINAQRGGTDNRGPRYESKDRNKPPAQSRAEFEAMARGDYKPGEAVLRMKQDMQSGNPQMWDLIAYRVLGTPHPRTGTKWKIYPTYDFTHCLCDSIENITHSLCTTEFITARESYEWLCDALEVYKPRQSEYGRLSLEGTLTSKRKLLKLVDNGYVDGWDDPRLYTLVALKRRGVPPGAIISFVTNLGVSTAVSQIQLSRFEQEIRSYLEMTTPRLMMVADPVEVIIENVPEDYRVPVTKKLHSKVPEMGENTIYFTKRIYIERADFRAEASPDFFRLAPGATVGLLNAPHPVSYVSHESTGNRVDRIVVRLETSSSDKPKSFIHWVPLDPQSNSPIHVNESRYFNRLFNSDNPAALPDFTTDINPESRIITNASVIETGFNNVVETAAHAFPDALKGVHGLESIRFQATRIAYFCVDIDSSVPQVKGTNLDTGNTNEPYLRLNLIARLKEDKGKSK